MKRRNETPNHVILPKPASFLGWATLLKSSVPHSNPLSLEKEFKSEDSVLVHRAFTSTASGTPFSWQRLLSVICLLQLFLWEGPPSAAWQGRELSSQMFFLSLSHPV